MIALTPWPNGLGYDLGDWILVLNKGRWHAVCGPAWFGGATHRGEGATPSEAIAQATPTEEFLDALDRAPSTDFHRARCAAT